MSISGNTVATWNASGRNAVYITNQSGNIAQSITAVSTLGDNHTFSTLNAQTNIGLNYAYDEAAGKHNRVRTTASGSVGSASGTQFRLLTHAMNTGGNVKAGELEILAYVSGGYKLHAPNGISDVGSTPFGIHIRVRQNEVLINSVDYNWVSGVVNEGIILESGQSIFLPLNQPDKLRFNAYNGPPNDFAYISWIAVDH